MRTKQEAIAYLAREASDRYFGGSDRPVDERCIPLLAFIYGEPIKVLSRELHMEFNRGVSRYIHKQQKVD